MKMSREERLAHQRGVVLGIYIGAVTGCLGALLGVFMALQ